MKKILHYILCMYVQRHSYLYKLLILVKTKQKTELNLKKTKKILIEYALNIKIC